MEKIRIRDGKKSDPGSEINIPDSQHWWNTSFFIVVRVPATYYGWDSVHFETRILDLESYCSTGPVSVLNKRADKNAYFKYWWHGTVF
jgi:hypothetical protein